MGMIVYGPRACGKTRNAEKLRENFGCDNIIDDAEWPKTEADLTRFKSGNDLLLISTDLSPETKWRRALSYEEAMDMIQKGAKKMISPSFIGIKKGEK